MEEISVRTYNCLCRKGFTTLKEVSDFVRANGPEWYRKINNLGVKSKDEIERAINLYGLS
jgi:DNA-directed RNA polymerase alpha subunit